MAKANQSRRSGDLACALERGEVVHFPVAPFALPDGADLDFLLAQQSVRPQKNIRYDLSTQRVRGHVRPRDPGQETRLSDLLAGFSNTVVQWLQEQIPAYQTGLHRDRVEYSPYEEATRRVRTTARNDLLHVDVCLRRPVPGARLLRVFANVNPQEPRVWVTSDPFAELLRRYGRMVGLPGEYRPGLFEQLQERLGGWIRLARGPQSPEDAFIQRLHNFMKTNSTLQMQCAKTVWHFQPFSVWLVMTDACSHAVLRGQFGLEHSLYVAPAALQLPDEAPLALLKRMGETEQPQKLAA